MKQLALLIKINTLLFLGALQKKQNKGRYVLTGILILFFLLFVGGSVSMQSIATSYHFTVEQNEPAVGIFTSILVAVIISLLFGVMRAATPTTSKDAELLLSMPIKKHIVVLSKIMSQYIFDAPLLIVMLLPTVLATRFFGGLSAWDTVRGIILVFLIPLFSLTITMLMGFLFSFLREKFSGSSIIISIIMISVFVAFLIGNFRMSSFFSNIAEMDSGQIDALMQSIWPVREMTFFVTNLGLTSALFAPAITLLPFAIMVMFYAQHYGRKEKSFRAKDKTLKYEERSIALSLLHVELKKYSSSALYVFNTFFGSILLLVFAIAVGVAGPERVMGLVSGVEGIGESINIEYLTGIIILMFSFFAAITITTSATLSGEGKRFWILRSMPLRVRHIFGMKIALSLMLFLPFSVVSSIFVAVRVGMSFQGALALILLPVVINVFMTVLGLIFNLLFPKLDWRTETEVFKNSASVLITVFVGMGMMLLPIIIFVLLFLTTGQAAAVYTAAYISTAIFILFLAAAILFLALPGKRLYEKMLY